MIEAHPEPVVRQVGDDDDQVDANAVGHEGHRDRQCDEGEPPSKRMEIHVRVQRADGDRGDQIVDTAAFLDHRPAAVRNREIHALAEDGDPAGAQRGDREIGRPIHQRGNEKFAERYREKQVRQRECQHAHDSGTGERPEDRNDRGHQHELLAAQDSDLLCNEPSQRG